MAAAAREISKWDDLTEEEKRMFDDIIDILARVNKSEEVASAETRLRFGAMVFRDWQPKYEVHDVLKIPPARTGIGYRVHGGFARHDLITNAQHRADAALRGIGPSERRRGRASNRSGPYQRPANLPNRDYPAHRRHGAKLYMKGSMQADDEHVSFTWHDEKGAWVSAADVNLKEGTTDALVRARTVDAWDRSEKERIGTFNHDLATYIARHRILELLDIDTPDYVKEEDLGKFYQLELMRDKLMEMARLINMVVEGLGPAPTPPSLF